MNKLKQFGKVDGIVGPEAIKWEKWFILMYGPSGAGKTTLLAQFPSIIIHDFDNGLLSINEMAGWKAKQYFAATEAGRADMWDEFIKDWPKILKMEEFNTFGFDSITTMGDSCMASVQQRNGNLGKNPTLPEWGTAIDILKDLIYDLLGTNKNVIFTAVEELVKDELIGSVRSRPMALGQKMPNRLPLWFDEVWRLAATPEKKMAKSTRMLYTASGMDFHAKSRAKVPSMENPTYEAIIKAVKGGEPE